MEAHRATDNIQQKASDCLGMVNEHESPRKFCIPITPETFVDSLFSSFYEGLPPLWGFRYERHHLDPIVE